MYFFRNKLILNSFKLLGLYGLELMTIDLFSIPSLSKNIAFLIFYNLNVFETCASEKQIEYLSFKSFKKIC
jgi:hypothetical protein